MIALSKIDQDSEGYLLINENSDSDVYNAEARISRTKTLDGGVVIDHRGFAHGDRNLNIKCNATAEDEAILRDLLENETLINISTADGFYEGSIKSINGINGSLTIIIWLKGSA